MYSYQAKVLTESYQELMVRTARIRQEYARRYKDSMTESFSFLLRFVDGGSWEHALDAMFADELLQKAKDGLHDLTSIVEHVEDAYDIERKLTRRNYVIDMCGDISARWQRG